MKKSFGLLLIALFVAITSVNAQDKVEQIADKTTTTIEKASTEANANVVYITEKLTELAKSLQVPAEKIYATMIKQQKIDSYVILSVYGVFVFIILVLLILSFKVGDESAFTIRIIIGGIGLLFFFFIWASIRDCLIGLNNPEYGVLRDISEMIKH